MIVTKQGLDLIKVSEGFKAKAYLDKLAKTKPWTIGYGSTTYQNGQKVKEGDIVTKEQALEMAAHYLTNVDAKIKHDLTIGQWAALNSFIYNFGPTKFYGSTLFKLINKNPADKNIPTEFKKWNKGDGKVLAGLVKRRAAEAALWVS